MKKILAFALALAVATPAAAQSVTYDSAPTGGFQYGAGNNYAPANATVLTNGNQELALRFHQTGQLAPASGGDGIYNFLLGTTPISFDWSIGVVDPLLGTADQTGALITVMNVGTGQTATYNPFFVGNDNTLTAGLDYQNSARLNFGFLLGAGFTPNVDSTYSVTLASGGNSLTNYAVLGAGAPPVPEPATWAMMLLGFGAIGVGMRRQRKAAVQLA